MNEKNEISLAQLAAMMQGGGGGGGGGGGRQVIQITPEEKQSIDNVIKQTINIKI